ncbi:MAG: nitrogenase [Clostridia bacterium]|nr:MAG: nitrogenase [Clostridia bacterium]
MVLDTRPSHAGAGMHPAREAHFCRKGQATLAAGPVPREARCGLFAEPPVSPELPAHNRPTLPGMVSQRSCPYYGARWALAPIPDLIHLVHGPVGCAFYGQTVRSQEYQLFSTDLAEKEVIFGTGEKLYRCLLEAFAVRPGARGALVYVTCTPGFLGEDLEATCRRAEKATGKRVVLVECPGFCGSSQAAGHDIAAEVLLTHFIGAGLFEGVRRTAADGVGHSGESAVNLVGEFNVRGDLDVIRSLLAQAGITVVCAFNADAPAGRMATAPLADLNLVHCRRTGLALAQGMQAKFDQPYLQVSFYGPGNVTASLREIGAALGREREVEAVIAAETPAGEKFWRQARRRLEGGRALLFFGGSRLGSMVGAFQELGLEVVVAGSQFGRRDDYTWAWEQVAPGTLLVDDANEGEIEFLLERYRPHLAVGGTKERYLCLKSGVPFLVFPQEGSPYAGYRGFTNLARDIIKALAAPVWRLIR